MIIHKILTNALLIVFILMISSFTASAGTVKIVTNIDPGDPDSTFEYKIQYLHSYEIVSITTKGGTGTVTVPLEGSGNDWEYKLIQLPKENWQIDSARCDNDFHPPDIYVRNEQTVTCTFVNSQIKEVKEVTLWDWFFNWLNEIVPYNKLEYKSTEKVFSPLSGEPEDDIKSKHPTASLGTERGHAILVPIDTVSKVTHVEIYGSIYDNGNKQFDIEIWDKNFNTLHSSSYNYVDYFLNGGSPPNPEEFIWATIDITDVDVSDDFYVALFTYSGPPSWHEKKEYERAPPFVRGGIEIGVDTLIRPANSYVVDRSPNRIVTWPTWNLHQDSTSWMISVSIE